MGNGHEIWILRRSGSLKTVTREVLGGGIDANIKMELKKFVWMEISKE
jgi:hypothetical protein